MSLENHARRLVPGEHRFGGFAGLVGGLLLVPYALTKGQLTTYVRMEGLGVAGLSPARTAQAFHVAETVPVLLLLVGLVALHGRLDPGTGGSRAGWAIAAAALVATVLTHLGEHLLPRFTAPALTGGENWFVWAYYLSWLAVYGGLALYGLALTRSGGAPRWMASLLVVGLPVAVAAGLAAVAFDLFTMAGVLRIGQGLTWAVIGYWLVRRPTPAGGGPATTP